MKVLITIPLTIIALLWNVSVYCQSVTANFTANKTSGCPPSVEVKFTAEATGSNITYSWDFGNGAKSTIKDPTAVFTTPGLYVVLLIVSDGSSTDSKTLPIRVYTPPTADFLANPVKGCTPFFSTFTDKSTKGDGTITQWTWDYRNGTTSTKQSPDPVSYTNQGKYSIYLKVTDSYGCSSQTEKANYIDAANKPVVSFTPTPDKSCKVPQMVTFNNTSTGIGAIEYLWDFGNGDQKNIRNPSTTYNAYGTYNVKLTVNESDYPNCSATLQYPAVNINQINAYGVIKQDTIVIKNNDTICAGTLSFSNQSTGTTNTYWNFGDGSTSYLANTSHTYNNQGKFTVTLIASSAGLQCSDTMKWIINVEKVTSNFTMSPTSGCTSPIQVNFTNASTNAKNYLWTFHDKTTSSATSPSKTFTIVPDKDPYVIHKDESLPIILTAYSPHGCKNEITKSFKVNLPTALFGVDKTEGCAPLNVSFTDKSLPAGNITTRKWIFGDNSEQTTSTSIIMHSYTNPGIYTSKLVVTDKDGCTDTSYTVTIKVGKKPQPNFQITSPASFYSDEWVTIADLTPAGDNADFWSYSINGFGIENNYNVKNPTLRFKKDIGNLRVKQIVGSNGCYDSISKINVLTGLGPIGAFKYNVTCTTPLKYAFTGTTKGATSYEWDFGDGSKNSATLTPEHTYGAAGDYFVKLITDNNGHKDTALSIIRARIPNAIFTTKANSCISDVIKFNSNASHTLFTTCQDKYRWNFGDDTPELLTDNDSIDHSFTKRGNFNVTLTALYENGCTSQYSQPITIFSPYATIKTDTTAGCDHLKVNFTDQSGADGSSLVKWDWNLGDGTDTSFTTGNHTFNKYFNIPQGLTSIVYPVVLSVTDTKGCIGTDTTLIRISIPSANFYTSSLSQLCSTDTAKFMRYYAEADSVIWYFGDGSKSRLLENPANYKYKQPGNYGVALKVYKYYCTDSVSKPQGFIQIQKADARFTVSDSVLNCNGEITFIHTGKMSPVDSGKWTFGDGYLGNYNDTSIHNYGKPLDGIASLRVYTSFGCADTAKKSIKVFAPYATIARTPSKACKGDVVTFYITDKTNVNFWNINFGEGVGYDNLDTIKYSFKSVGLRPVSLIAYRDSGCKYAVTENYPIEEVIAQIGITDTSVCEGTNIKFTNQSIGQTSFIWDLDNGITSTLDNPEQTFSSGVFDIKLAVTNNSGCKDTAIRQISISPQPVITISEDTVLCVGSSLILHASGGNVINWQPNKWLTETNIYHPTSNADSTIKYIAEVSIDSTGCFAKDSVLVTVQQKPNYTLNPDHDTSIFVGDQLDISITANESYQYVWTPLTYLTCNTDCSSATVIPEDTITYFLTVKDVNNCFDKAEKIKITIKDTCLFNVAGAFTPDGEEKNRILKVEGKGIKQLMEFTIYNRWGNVVFQSNDITKGWDGTFKGKAQPIDSYVYTITVMTYKGFKLSKKGSVLLIR